MEYDIRKLIDLAHRLEVADLVKAERQSELVVFETPKLASTTESREDVIETLTQARIPEPYVRKAMDIIYPTNAELDEIEARLGIEETINAAEARRVRTNQHIIQKQLTDIYLELEAQRPDLQIFKAKESGFLPIMSFSSIESVDEIPAFIGTLSNYTKSENNFYVGNAPSWETIWGKSYSIGAVLTFCLTAQTVEERSERLFGEAPLEVTLHERTLLPVFTAALEGKYNSKTFEIKAGYVK